MANAEKVGEGVYRTADGSFEIVQWEEGYRVNELKGNRWVEVGTAKTLSAAQKQVTQVEKEEAAAAEAQEAEIVEAREAEVAQREETAEQESE